MPSPSPTTTSAVKLKRRPPLTTLATRLIVTTRSMNAVFSAALSRGPRSFRSRRSRRPEFSPVPPPAPAPGPPPPRRWGPAIRGSFPSSSSQCQTAFAGAVRHRGHPAVVPVAAAVEDHGLDTGGLGALGDELADLARLDRLVAFQRPQIDLEGRRRGQRAADHVVDHLGDDVPGGPGHHQAGTLGGAGDLLAHAQMTAGTGGVLPLAGATTAALHTDGHFLPAFPTLRRITSPAYRTPLPLYGSGLRSLRRFAATSPTCCLSMPATVNRVGPSTVKVTPEGGVTTMGWL